MAVRIRLKRLGRRHRPFFRLCVMDQRTPRDGKVLEELGTYDPSVTDVDARAIVNGERINYWLSVGALPTAKAGVLIKKYGAEGTHAAEQKAALERLARPREIPDAGPPAVPATPPKDAPAAEPPPPPAAAEAVPIEEAEEPSAAAVEVAEQAPPAAEVAEQTAPVAAAAVDTATPEPTPVPEPGTASPDSADAGAEPRGEPES